MKIWYAIPSANPARARRCLARWKEMGCHTAVLLDEGAEPVEADLVLTANPYRGYYQSFLRLCRAIGDRADIVVTGGDDITPDPKKSAMEIGAEFFDRFPDGYGVMQPTGDTYGKIDQTCISPWIGKGWIRRAYRGSGPVCGDYIGYCGDMELFSVAKAQGVLWIRPDLVQFHEHWSRPGGPPKTDYQRANDRFWETDARLLERRRQQGFPGHEPLPPAREEGLAVVTGAGGFIGHHLVSRLKADGRQVRGVDLKLPDFEPTTADEFVTADLRDRTQASRALRDAVHVYALAANMGGIGFIETHKGEIVRDNTMITLMTLEAAREAGASRLFFASSACVYPAAAQSASDAAPLREDQAYPADPEDGYGWEKLYAERLCRHYREDFGLDTRIARFHNIYGPLGAFQGGREKSPAAICRKVATARDGDPIEIWGDGRQVRSYCYVGDCVEGIVRLMRSSCVDPVNLGTDRPVTTDELVDLVARVAGRHVRKRHDPSRAQGVRGRNSDNTMLREVLRWQPSTPLEEGLRKTYEWISARMRNGHDRMDPADSGARTVSAAGSDPHRGE